MPHRPNHTQTTWAICLFLAVATVFVYWGVFSSQFTGYDDPYYVVLNQQVHEGLTWNGVCWAFTTQFCENWHPLTWLSLMLDSSVYGPDPLGFHATNLVLHILNTILLFLLLQRMTGASWRSGFVAALFALHPLHVESVAWVSERKDVLSTFFGLLAIGAYVRYAQKSPGVEALGSRFWTRDYFLVLLFFAFSLMSKPMLVTLPFLLLLLDFWPLRRMPPALKLLGREFQIAETETPTPFRQCSLGRLVWEKVPLLALSAMSTAVTIWAQTHAFVLTVAFKYRLLNAALSYLRYLEKTVWPTRLYLIYLYRNNWPAWYFVVAIIIVVGLSVLALREARRRPYVFVGWFWFIGTLLPVIGLLQVGTQSLADRYTYLPLVGLFIAVAWLGCDWAQRWRIPQVLLDTLAALVITACIPVTITQVGYWKDSLVLCDHALRLDPKNFLVQTTLGMTYEDRGRLEPALKYLTQAVHADPAAVAPYQKVFGDTFIKLGWVQVKLGKYPDAVTSFQAALQRHGSPMLAHCGLALTFDIQGRTNEADQQIQAALALKTENPDDANLHDFLNNLIQEKARKSRENAPPPR